MEGEGRRRKGPKKRGRKWVRRREVEGERVDTAWSYLYLSLRDATAAASGPVWS